MIKKLFVGLVSFGLIGLLLYPQSTHSQTQQDCNITVDRSAVPDFDYKDLTFIVQVNDSAEIVVSDSNGTDIPFTQSGATILFNTDTTSITVTLIPGTNLANLCETTVAPLLNNKRWAWSHGFDDNVDLVPAIDAFKAKSWPATLFLIAKDYDQFRQETHWIIDEPYVNSEIVTVNGWAIGNHSWDHERFEVANPTIEDYRKDIRDAQEKLEVSLDRSSNPDLKIISFASPNFSDKYEQPFADVSATTDLILLETGADFLITVNESSSYTSSDRTASPFNGRNKIGRDATIEWAPEVVIDIMDWMSANSSEYRRFWYNSLAHGGQESNIQTVLDHAWGNYGPGGTDELWVATSTEIYSYLMTRDTVEISVEMTESDSSIPEIEDDNDIYLPMISAMRNWASKIKGEPTQDQVQNILLKVSGHGLQQLKEK